MILKIRKLLWKAFDLVDLARVLSGEKLIQENSPQNAEGFLGNGVYFYDSVQKAIEQTLTYQTLNKRDLLDLSINLSRSEGKLKFILTQKNKYSYFI